MVKYRKCAQQPQVYRTRYHVFQLYQLEYVICVYRFLHCTKTSVLLEYTERILSAFLRSQGKTMFSLYCVFLRD